ncbi:MAG TPA: hypothetical protein DCQ93_01535 [Bacteroidetes bacterium]|nr:hypothetical protein [Bacteroidota bacterium]
MKKKPHKKLPSETDMDSRLGKMQEVLGREFHWTEYQVKYNSECGYHISFEKHLNDQLPNSVKQLLNQNKFTFDFKKDYKLKT